MDCFSVFVNQVLRLAELKSVQFRDGFQALQNIRFGIQIAIKLSSLDRQTDRWMDDLEKKDGDILSRLLFLCCFPSDDLLVPRIQPGEKSKCSISSSLNWGLAQTAPWLQRPALSRDTQKAIWCLCQPTLCQQSISRGTDTCPCPQKPHVQVPKC